MPTYLRWIVAISSGLMAQFAFFVVVGAIAVGTDNEELGGGIGLIVTLLNVVVAVLPALAINDWLATRYPKQPAAPAADEPAGSKIDA